MSVFNYPRIHFRGTFTVNPATADNDDVAMGIDTANVTLLPALETLTDPQALAFLMEGVSATSVVNQQTFQYLRGGWNPFGDLTTQFVTVRVCSVVDADEVSNTSDAIVGSWLALDGSPPDDPQDPPSKPKLCDLDPLGTASAQLFIGGFRVGDANLGLEATCDRKAFSRWVAFRNATVFPGEQNFTGAGAVWQFTIPKEHLRFHGTGTDKDKYKDDPSVLKDLQGEMEKEYVAGIVVQFATFQVMPSLTDAELIAILQNPSNTTSNPANGLVVGSIGVWVSGEPATSPVVARLMLPPEDRGCLEQLVGPAAAFLGPAMAVVHSKRDVVSLNLIATFPEDGYQAPLTKADFGCVRLGLVPADDGEPIAISEPIDYDYQTYELNGGIIDVELITTAANRDAIAAGTLVLLADPDESGNWIPIVEEPERVVTVLSVGDNDTGVYLDIDEETTLSIIVTERGGPPTEDVTVFLWEYQYVTEPGDSQKRAASKLHRVGAGTARRHRLKFPRRVEVDNGQTDPIEITVSGKRAGGAVIAFTLDGKPLPDGYPWKTAFYAGFRVLPDDDFSDWSEEDRVSWDFMYEQVFRYYRLIFPAMSTVVPFDNQQEMEAAAGLIFEATVPCKKQSTRYMPVSRDLSTGKRKLIEDWYHSLHKPRNTIAPRAGGVYKINYWP